MHASGGVYSHDVAGIQQTQAAAWRAAGDAAKAAAAASGEPLPTLPESAVPLAAFRACACDLLTHRCLGCARAYCGDNPATAGCANIREALKAAAATAEAAPEAPAAGDWEAQYKALEAEYLSDRAKGGGISIDRSAGQARYQSDIAHTLTISGQNFCEGAADDISLAFDPPLTQECSNYWFRQKCPKDQIERHARVGEGHVASVVWRHESEARAYFPPCEVPVEGKLRLHV